MPRPWRIAARPPDEPSKWQKFRERECAWYGWKIWTSGLLLVLAIGILFEPFSTTTSALRWNWHSGSRHSTDHETPHIIDLGGAGWTLRSQNGSISIPASVPSQQYIDLLNAGVIDDPLFGENNENQQWVRDQNWTYSRTLSDLRNNRNGSLTSTYLVFLGLDTFTTITLCGQIVASTQNQYRQYIFDISRILKSCRGSPELSLNFGPAIPITHQVSRGVYSSENVNHANSCNASEHQKFNCRAYARKQQSDFGWDWSPSLAPAGPWRPIYAVQLGRNHVFINNALIDVYRRGQMNNLPPDQSQPWIFNASIDYIGAIPEVAEMQLTLSDTSGKRILRQSLRDVYRSANSITGSTTIDPGRVQLWWPNNMGPQSLYTARIDIIAGQFRESRDHDNGQILASIQRRIGFRTIVLNLGNVTKEQIARGVAPGSNWHFEINGNEFYAKGSNLVPPDVFWPRVNETQIRLLFALAKEANLNMLRVWSSGTYLDDWVYDIADEMGLLLWSEFQFSDAVYPSNDAYLEEYEAEAYYNVRRLNYHPSLALWAGGNELETIVLADWYGSSVMEDYAKLQEELLIKCVYANTRSISYIPSSTYNGYLSLDFDSVRPMTARYMNTSGPGFYYSDTDAYNYDARFLLALRLYPTGRFANEFGFISMPSLKSWELEAPSQDLYYPSGTVIGHNRHVPLHFVAPVKEADTATVLDKTPNYGSLAGIKEMTDAVKMYLPSPNLQDSKANFSAWCYSTQIIHAEAVTQHIAFYRRGSGMRERQLGALYWQFNDLWAAPTWASIEVSGRQKLVYYTAKDIFSPVIVYPYWDEYRSDLQIWVTSDLWDSMSGVVEYQWFDFNGNSLPIGPPANTEAQEHQPRVAKSPSVPFTVGAINTTQVLHYSNLRQQITSKSIKLDSAVLLLSLTAGSYKHTAVFHPGKLVDATLPDPGLKLSKAGNSFTVTATKAVAAWVWLDYDTNDVQGYWSSNAFWLNKGETKTVIFTVLNDSTGGRWADAVSVRSIYDNTQP